MRVMAIVLAGGEGKRLMPLTADRAKPAVPFGGAYRLTPKTALRGTRTSSKVTCAWSVGMLNVQRYS